jgi:hypothetical protein
MTSIKEQLGRDVPLSEAKGPLTHAFENVFNTKLETASEETLTNLEKRHTSGRA